MIISFKHKFIFIKNYKTAGSSIEFFLQKFLTNRDIVSKTRDIEGINNEGDFDKERLKNIFPDNEIDRYAKHRLAFFPHMPIWLVKERLKPLEEKFEYNIFDNFYKFAFIRNPFDLIVSDYFWQNNKNNPNRNNFTFKQIIDELQNNQIQSFRLFNLNRIMDFKLKNILCDEVFKFENLNSSLSKICKKIDIPFKGNLEIHLKKSSREKNYKDFYDSYFKKIIEEIFYKELEIFDYKF